MRISYIGQSARAKSTNAADIDLINGYAEIAEHKQSKSMITVYRTPGLALWETLTGAGGIRGLFYAASQNRAFAVQGSTLWELHSQGVFSVRGTLQSVQGPVQMDENGVALAIADGAARYSLTFATNSFQFDLNVSFPVASRVGFVDGYFVYVKPGDKNFYWSDLLSTTVQPLNFAAAEGRPDPLVSLLVHQREVWLFGTETTQPFYSTGNADQPFAPVGAVFIPHGTVAVQSPAVTGDTVCWLSRNREGQGLVLQASGQQARPVSTHAVAEAIQRYAVLDDAIGFSCQMEGHLQYILQFPTADATWVFDLTTGLWHQLARRDPVTGFFKRHRSNAYMFAFSKHLVGDFESGNIYVWDMDTYTDDSQPLVLEAVFPPLFDDNMSLIQQDWLVLEVETGVGLDGSIPIEGIDPQVELFVSDDSGHTYPPALTRSLGPRGKTRSMVEWRALGCARDRRCKIRCSAPVKFALTGVLTQVTPLKR